MKESGNNENKGKIRKTKKFNTGMTKKGKKRKTGKYHSVQ